MFINKINRFRLQGFVYRPMTQKGTRAKRVRNWPTAPARNWKIKNKKMLDSYKKI